MELNWDLIDKVIDLAFAEDVQDGDHTANSTIFSSSHGIVEVQVINIVKNKRMLA